MKIEMGPYPSLYDVQLDLFGKEEIREQKVSIHIDEWDTWNMDKTLAQIIVPMLHQLKRTKHGGPYVDYSDVPEYLRPMKPISEYEIDSKHFERWDWVVDEMIFAFENQLYDWTEQFWIEQPQIDWDKFEENKDTTTLVDWVSHGKFDQESHDQYYERIKNGFRLFGKYYSDLWD